MIFLLIVELEAELHALVNAIVKEEQSKGEGGHVGGCEVAKQPLLLYLSQKVVKVKERLNEKRDKRLNFFADRPNLISLHFGRAQTVGLALKEAWACLKLRYVQLKVPENLTAWVAPFLKLTFDELGDLLVESLFADPTGFLLLDDLVGPLEELPRIVITLIWMSDVDL